MIDIDINNQIMLGIAAFVVLLLLGNVLYIMFKDNKKDKEEIDELMNSMKERKKQQTVVKQQKNKTKEQPVESVEVKLEPVSTMESATESIEEPATVISKQEESTTPIEVIEDKKVEFNEKKSEIEEMLEKMQRDLEAKTEDIVENFEKEQEEKSIISYQELLKTMKENSSATTKRQPTAAPIEIKQPTVTSSEVKPYSNPIEELIVEEPTIEEPVKEETIVKEDNPAVKKFKNTDFISPIYGKMEDHLEYPKVPVFHPKEQIEFDFDSTIQENMVQDVIEEFDRKLENHNIDDYLEDFNFDGHMKIDSLEQTLDMPPISPEIKENEEFLKALKEFRRNLE